MKLIKKIKQDDFDLLYDLESRFIICESYKSVIRSILSDPDICIDEKRFNKYVEDYIKIFSEVQLYRNMIIKLYLPNHIYDIDNLISFIDRSIIITTDDTTVQKTLINIGYIVA